jgi:tetratricopeptide (TPR) repeat protein
MKLILRYSLFIFALCFLSTKGFAASNTDFDNANEQYKKGEYKSAISSYEKILKSGYDAAEVYYDLGNCYYKLNDVPHSILNYERALKLAPRDEDIIFNLRLANLKVIDKIQSVDQVFFKRWIENISNLYSTDSAALWTIIFLWCGLIVFALFILSGNSLVKRIFFYSGAIILVLSILFLIVTNYRNQTVNAINSGIIFNPSVYVKSAPDTKSTDLFILHEGTKVKILDTVGSWKKIRLMNNNEGWIKGESLEVI